MKKIFWENYDGIPQSGLIRIWSFETVGFNKQYESIKPIYEILSAKQLFDFLIMGDVIEIAEKVLNGNFKIIE